MRIDQTCPVEAWKVTLPTAETPSCDVTLFNLSSLQVVSVEVTILLSSADGEETAKGTYRGRGLNGAPGKTFHMTVPVEGYITPERYEITVDKVWYDNASVWRREKENMISYEPNNLHRSAQLTTLRSIAGDMSSGYPDQQDGLWVCVCGRPNLDETTVCARCHREKAEVFEKYSREAIAAIVAQREEALAEHGRDTLRQTSRKYADEKDFVRRKGKFAWVWKLIAALVIIAGLAFAGYEYGLPFVKYELAMKAFEEGDYAEAAEQFEALGEYKDAPHMVQYCLLCHENEQLTKCNILPAEEYAQHLAILNALDDFEADIDGETVSAADLRLDCDWKHAEYLFQNARYDEAEALYTALGDQYEAPARRKEIEYIRACDLFDDARWEEARAAFSALGDYQDSADRYLETWYTPAVTAMEVGDTETALALLGEIPGHRDADTLILKIHYGEGVRLRAEGKINEAAEAFYLAKGYEDAEAQANEGFYVPASVAYEIMEYEEAALRFAKIRGYRDAEEKWRDATLKAADKAISQINY